MHTDQVLSAVGSRSSIGDVMASNSRPDDLCDPLYCIAPALGFLATYMYVVLLYSAQLEIRYCVNLYDLLQRVSIACYAERCISYDRFCPTV